MNWEQNQKQQKEEITTTTSEMFRILELLKQDTQAKFVEMFRHMDRLDFFFTTPEIYESWRNRIELWSSEGLSDIVEVLSQSEKKGVLQRFLEMKKICDVHYIKDLICDIKDAYDKWKNAMYYSKTITLRYVILQTGTMKIFESLFREQAGDIHLSSLTLLEDKSNMMIIPGNPNFYYIYKKNGVCDYTNMYSLTKYRLECFLDIPFHGDNFKRCSPMGNPGYGKYMDSCIMLEQIPYVFLRQYNKESLWEKEQKVYVQEEEQSEDSDDD